MDDAMEMTTEEFLKIKYFFEKNKGSIVIFYILKNIEM